jgi:predicted nucleotidyltransferase
MAVLEGLGSWKASAIVHGSLARGDVDDKSDIDILIPVSVSTQLVESSLETAGFETASREIAQATPMHSPKAHLYLDSEQKTGVTIPLTPFRRLEEEFYRFGGIVAWKDLSEKVRTRGCTKKLTLIEPIEMGHVESPVVGRESEVARILGVSSDIVRERARVLTRRDAIGRTGVFLKLPVPEGVSFEEALDQETKDNPALRRTLRGRKSLGS